ncbi:MAG TPA: hypothetical protein IAC03_07965 [Candidatus Coprenecus pullistercoris]|nr:hypothetical protein [Candidatus Coprenecus pullistercoris]
MFRKTITVLILLIGAVQAYAQLTPQYTDNALAFSSRYYDGTARSVGMGNAMTALGGDLGALSYNPAASGVYRYSEITLTPSVYSGNTNTTMLGDLSHSSISRFSLSNVGWVGSFDTGRTRGLLNFNFAITANQSNNFAYRSSGSGFQSQSSYLGSLAASMTGLSPDNMTMPEGYPDRPFFAPGGAAWDQILGWNTGLVDSLRNSDSFIGATENISQDGQFYVPGTLVQRYDKVRTGYVEDIILNLSGNVDNIFIFGANLKFQSIWMNEHTSISETAGNPALFETGFTDFTYDYRMTTSGFGVGVEAGFIVRPTAGLTIGGSISTPTWMFLTETWMQSMTGYTGQYGGSAVDSPVGEFSYRVTSPFRFNLGIGYTIGGWVALGLDYERTDYSCIALADDSGNRSVFETENSYMSAYYKAVNNLRAGIEAWPHPQVAIRLGYNYYSSPYRTTGDSPYSSYDNDRHYASAGIGFRSPSGFFVDLAYQQQCNRNNLSFLLYNTYDNKQVPSVQESFLNWKILLTLGWRF